ncbi:hypothetical protein [Amycolatopsis sp. NPDC059657]|uniref:hypothetical protein n=1 Tax=Amycolatopsis sp. NPDC059657 TaxID=3346899 RepID=UPI003670D97A
MKKSLVAIAAGVAATAIVLGAPAQAFAAPKGKSSGSVILFDDKNFSENGAAQGLAGRGCQNVFRDDIASSLSANGAIKIWSGANCTGRSAVVSGDVLDLGTIGFDNEISSVAFG